MYQLSSFCVSDIQNTEQNKRNQLATVPEVLEKLYRLRKALGGTDSVHTDKTQAKITSMYIANLCAVVLIFLWVGSSSHESLITSERKTFG